MIEIKMPEAGFSITEGTVVKWYKAVGERVAEGVSVVSVETDKITVDIPAETTGILQEIRYREGEIVPVGAVMGTIGGERETAEVKQEPIAEKKDQPARAGSDEARPPGTVRSVVPEMRISPAAKALAKTRGIKLALITEGSGPHGRVVKQDVIDIITKMEAAHSQGEKRAVGDGVLTEKRKEEQKDKRVEFKGWRKVLADRMLASTQEIPRYTMSAEADVTELSRMIKKLREKDEKLHITYVPFMLKAMALGLEQVPNVNSHCDKSGYTILEEINIGIAVDLGEKLLVPVVKDVRGKSILELVRALDALIQKARADKLEPRDIEGGTITLTNVGMFQTVSATSIIMPPQVAIVYMGVAREVPAVWEGRIEVRTHMAFGATYDHRVVNGAAGGRFLLRVKECLEDISTFIQY